ncbi:hypothetical protein PLESTB_000927900 [Pleodorina starrii]|uniref:Uncharacterized protein n=1 Tax=Pleodorina starrii TaxID=330485 RepID=A0A9W6F3E6_9CHLO|nr:hypothetical protein PLESTM_001557100 [Pleodorina starrii]GLC54987.1 hypothetical protein PLESTB_000927900 [Pleodorina starrii]GLC68449.1 hypothetical protein PLESTF_000692800 [Pleodorina starrii]
MTTATQRLAKSAWPEWQQGSSKTAETIRYDTFITNGTLGAPEIHDPSEPGHSTTTFVPLFDTMRQKRHTSTSSVPELSPRAQSTLMKHRASALIQKYSGNRWREAQRTKWLLDIVFHIDRDYRQYLSEQAAQIAALNEQLEHNTELQMSAAEAVQSQNGRLRRRVDELEQQLRHSQGSLLDMQNRVAASEIALQEAEDASRAAVEECLQLQQAVAILAEHDASARKLLANRTHGLKEALVASRGRMRQAAENSKRHRLEVADLLAQERQKAEAERLALTVQVEGSLAAAGTVLGAATRLQVDRLKLELDAYKEPWQYAARDKSPTRRKELTRQLEHRQRSTSVTVPF